MRSTRRQDAGWEGRIVQLLNNTKAEKETETDQSSPNHESTYSTHGSKSILIHGDLTIHLHFSDNMEQGGVEEIVGRICAALRAKEGKNQ